MKKVTICLLFSLIFIGGLVAQVEEGIKSPPADFTGNFGINDAKLFDQLMLTVPGVGNARAFLSQQTVKPYMMPVRKTGVQGTDLSYALATCLEFYFNLNKNYKSNLSPDYIALSLKNAQKTITLEESLLFLINNGTVDAAIMPYDSYSIPNAVYSTKKFKLTNYLHIFRSFTKEKQKVFEVRKALMRGNPVVVNINADNSIRNVSNQEELDLRGNPTTPFPFIVVGYDEGRNALELMSTWGSTWGNSGYIWVSYDDFGKYATDGYVMIPSL